MNNRTNNCTIPVLILDPVFHTNASTTDATSLANKKPATAEAACANQSLNLSSLERAKVMHHAENEVNDVIMGDEGAHLKRKIEALRALKATKELLHHRMEQLPSLASAMLIEQNSRNNACESVDLGSDRNNIDDIDPDL
jgi:hypothetical protein